MDKFGYELNSKGYRVLPPYVRVIQGDGIDVNDIELILETMENCNMAAENIAFGCGGGLLQKVNRDTLKFAMKANAIWIDGTWHDVYKQPLHQKDKDSKRGKLALLKVEETGEFRTIREDAFPQYAGNLLSPVFVNGSLLVQTTFDEVRERAEVL
jgi:nicotinamide phosphoribosyltransferase